MSIASPTRDGAPRTATVAIVVKKALVVLLVLVVLLTGLPILMGMSGMATCFDCGPAVLLGAGCVLAVLASAVALLFALFVRRLRLRRDIVLSSLHSFLLERPPRLA